MSGRILPKLFTHKFTIKPVKYTSDVEAANALQSSYKKLTSEIWEFRTLYAGLQYRLLAFWDKTDNKETLVLASHGFIKKTSKVGKKEIDRAERIREIYFKEK